MTEETVPPHSVSQLRRRRGVVRASVTRVGNRLKELEDTEAHSRTCARAVHEIEGSRFQL